jgi:hypothetical protein
MGLMVVNRVTIKNLGDGLFMVNLNGKGMFWECDYELALEHADNIRYTAKEYTRRGIRY